LKVLLQCECPAPTALADDSAGSAGREVNTALYDVATPPTAAACGSTHDARRNARVGGIRSISAAPFF
jgi:hypothetical protein